MCSEDLCTRMNRREFLRLGGTGLAGAVLLGTVGGRALAQTGSSLKTEFEAAAKEYGVPVELLLAMGFVNTLWEMPPPGASDYDPGNLHGRGDYGIMQLTRNPSRDTLGRAAELTGLSEDRLKNDRASNVRGATAVLADIAGQSKPPDLDGWQEVVAEYGDTDLYASEVYRKLQEGASMEISTGESVRLDPQDVDTPRIYTTQGTNTDYPLAVWRPAYPGNRTYSTRERSYDINRVVIHVVQGSYVSAINWFQDPSANVSAHYVVNRNGQVAQCVRHQNIAWHAGNWSYNTRSIGIEHGGYGSNPSTWSDAMYRSSARLTAYCCKRHGIPVDRRHIIGHRNVPGGTSSCPGPYFNFERYLNHVRYYRRRL